jgi:hypothetical protein
VAAEAHRHRRAPQFRGVAGRPVTQQPASEQGWKAPAKALPPLPAVVPVDRLSLSFSVAGPRLTTTTVDAAVPPAASVMVK